MRITTILVLLLGCNVTLAALSLGKVSPWQSASWRLVLNVGREPSTSLPVDWGASGARLVLPLEVRVESDVLPPDQQDPLLGGSGARRLTVLSCNNKKSSNGVDDDKPYATFINNHGEQRVPFVATGGWKLRLGRQPGHASLVRMWIDVGASNSNSKSNVVAEKQDVRLNGGSRFYLAAHGWRQADLEIGQRRIRPLVEAYEQAQAKLEGQVSHDDGDRRLDGTDPLQTLAAYKDMAGLTLDRNDKLRRLQEAQETLPPPTTLPLGNWPGSDELLALKPLELFVQEQHKGGLLGAVGLGGEEYHLMGTWGATPLHVVTAAALEEEDEDDDGDDEVYEYHDGGSEEDDNDDAEDEDEDEDEDENDNAKEEMKTAIFEEFVDMDSSAIGFTFEADTQIDRDDYPKQQRPQ